MPIRQTFSRLFTVLMLALIVAFSTGIAAQQSTPQPTPTVEPTDAPPVGPVSTVNGEEISAEAFQARVRATRFLYAYTIRETFRGLVDGGMAADQSLRAVQSYYNDNIGQLLIGDELGANTLDIMEADAVLKQLAEAQSVTVSEDDVDAQLRAFLDRPAQLTQSEEATPEPTEETLQSTPDPAETLYTEAARRANVSREAIHDYFYSAALRGQFAQTMLGPFPSEWPYVTARHILVATEDEANDALARLNAGEDFADVAADMSIDQGSKDQGGELGTVVPELYVEPVANAVRDAPIGEVIGPVQSQFGWHVIEVTARETRPLDAQGVQALTRFRAAQFRSWLDNQINASTISRVENWPDLIPRQPNGEDLLREMLSEV